MFGLLTTMPSTVTRLAATSLLAADVVRHSQVAEAISTLASLSLRQSGPSRTLAEAFLRATDAALEAAMRCSSSRDIWPVVTSQGAAASMEAVEVTLPLASEGH